MWGKTVVCQHDQMNERIIVKYSTVYFKISPYGVEAGVTDKWDSSVLVRVWEDMQIILFEKDQKQYFFFEIRSIRVWTQFGSLVIESQQVLTL